MAFVDITRVFVAFCCLFIANILHLRCSSVYMRLNPCYNAGFPAFIRKKGCLNLNSA